MKKLFGLLILAVLLVTGCKEEPVSGTIQFNLIHEVDGQTLEFDNMIYNSAAGHPFEVKRLKYYISNFSLRNTDGTSYETDVVHYCEEGIDDTKIFTLDRIPPGTYDQVSFIFGLDEDTNVNGGLENTIENANMEWPIPGDQGYHYMKFEGFYDSLGTGVILSYNLHTGAAQNNQNYVVYTLDFPTDVRIDNNTWEVDLMMDMMEWIQNPQVYDFAEFGQAIMMNQTAQEVLKANGVDVWSIEKVVQQ